MIRICPEYAGPALDLPTVKTRLTQCFKNQTSSYAQEDPFLHKIIDTPNILRNINYTGDMLCQKTYRDDQYHCHFNQGELPQYLIEEHHPSLVNHETFNRAQVLLKEAAQKRHIETGSHKYQHHYLFSGKIICGNCGTTFKRQTRPHKIYWACQKHLRSAKQCPTKAVSEAGLEAAFCNMMNKLVHSRKFLLQPLLEALKEEANANSDGQLISLNKQIKTNDHKAETLTQLMQTGLLDRAIYINQTTKLEQDTYQCQEKIKQLSRIFVQYYRK